MRSSTSVRFRLLLGGAYFLALIAFHVSQNSAASLLQDGDEWQFGHEVGHVGKSVFVGEGFSVRVRGPNGELPSARVLAWKGFPVHGPEGTGDPRTRNSVPISHVTPVYPILLAGIFTVFGLMTPAAAWATIVLNCLFQAGALVVFEAVARRLLQRTAAVLAVALYAANYGGFVFSAHAWPQSLYMLSVLLLLYVTLFSPAGAGRWSLGLVACLLLLVDKSAAVLVGLAGLYRLWIHGWSELRPLMMSAAVALLLMAPWAIRNGRAVGVWSPLANSTGTVAWMGNSPRTQWFYYSSLGGSYFYQPDEIRRLARVGEKEYNRDAGSRALEYITSDLPRFLDDTANRFVIFWTSPEALAVLLDRLAFRDLDPGKQFQFLWRILILLPLPLGVALALRRPALRQPTLLFTAILLFFPVVYYLTLVTWRFCSPIDSVVCLLVGQGMGLLLPSARSISGAQPEAPDQGAAV